MQIKIFEPGEWLLCHYAVVYGGILSGWFQDHNFIVLDYLPKPNGTYPAKNTTNVVYFPDYPTIYNDRKFGEWARFARKEDYFHYIKVNKEKFLPEFKVNDDLAAKYRDQLSIVDEFISDLESIINEKYPFNKLYIYPSYFGTRGSYFRGRVNNNLPWVEDTADSLHFILRDDQGADAFIKLLLRAYIHFGYAYKQRQIEWESVEHIVYFYLNNTKLSKYIEKYPHEPLIKKLNAVEQDKELLEQSKAYLTKLSAFREGIVSIDKNDVINIEGVPLLLTGNKFILLKLLVQNKGRTCTFDEITNQLYGSIYEVDKFSIQYITKLVEETRKYLFSKGISKNIINTIRGKGYMIR